MGKDPEHSKQIQSCDSPVTLVKVSSLGSDYIAAVCFLDDWKGQQSSNVYQNKQARIQLEGRIGYAVYLEWSVENHWLKF